MATVKFEIDAETARGITNILKVAQSFKTVEGAAGKARKKGDDVDATFKKMKRSAMGVAGALGIGGGVAGALTTVVSLARQWQDYMDGIGGRFNEINRKSISFALVMGASPQLPQQEKRAIEMGARYGVGPVQSKNTVQSMTSLLNNDFEKGLQASRSPFMANQAGMDITEAENITAAAVNKGYPDWMGTNLALQAGLASHKDPATLAKMGRMFPFAKDIQFATATAPALLAGTSPDEFQTFGKRAFIALNSEQNKKANRLFKKLDVFGGTEPEKIAALSKAGLDTPTKLEKYFPEMRERTGIALMTQAYDRPEITSPETGEKVQTLKIKDFYEQVKRDARENFFPERMKEARKSSVGADIGLRTQETAAQTEAAHLFSEEGKRSIAHDAYVKAQAKELVESGRGFLTKEAKGEDGVVSRVPGFFARTLGLGVTEENRFQNFEDIFRQGGNLSDKEKREFLGSAMRLLRSEGISKGDLFTKHGIDTSEVTTYLPPGGPGGTPQPFGVPSDEGFTRLIELLERIETNTQPIERLEQIETNTEANNELKAQTG